MVLMNQMIIRANSKGHLKRKKKQQSNFVLNHRSIGYIGIYIKLLLHTEKKATIKK